MEPKDLIVDAFGRISGLLKMSLKGLTAEQLAQRPTEGTNSIAWLAWHLSRVQDHHLSDLAHHDQAWVAEGWHARFEKPADPHDTGFGYTPQQVAGIHPAGPEPLLDYHQAVYQRTLDYLATVTPADLDVVLNEPQYDPMPTVGVRLVSVVSDNLQHAGQIAYLRGWIEGRRWFPA
ncbi:MAG: DinB family protein [Chloroflexota bacterium]|nr:DinB family protein [Chloroflexota bacterium]